ncbi:MAG: hypothetical protein M3N27_03060, partial [Thermoproteota archaeon]|nr:hypothetical protein [Thermoproteota archaeon]
DITLLFHDILNSIIGITVLTFTLLIQFYPYIQFVRLIFSNAQRGLLLSRRHPTLRNYQFPLAFIMSQ